MFFRHSAWARERPPKTSKSNRREWAWTMFGSKKLLLRKDLAKQESMTLEPFQWLREASNLLFFSLKLLIWVDKVDKLTDDMADIQAEMKELSRLDWQVRNPFSCGTTFKLRCAHKAEKTKVNNILYNYNLSTISLDYKKAEKTKVDADYAYAVRTSKRPWPLPRRWGLKGKMRLRRSCRRCLRCPFVVLVVKGLSDDKQQDVEHVNWVFHECSWV